MEHNVCHNASSQSSSLEMITDWISKQSGQSSLSDDDDDVLVIAEEDSDSVSETSKVTECELIQSPRSGTPVPKPDESWLEHEDLQVQKERPKPSRPRNVQGIAGMVINVLRDYYSIGPEATRKKSVYAPFYSYLDGESQAAQNVQTAEFKEENYLKMFVHEEAISEQPEYDGYRVLKESVLWPETGNCVVESEQCINVEPSEDIISLLSLDCNQQEEPEILRTPVKMGSQLVKSVNTTSVTTSDGDDRQILLTQREPIVIEEAPRSSPGPSRGHPPIKDLRHKLNANKAAGLDSVFTTRDTCKTVSSSSDSSDDEGGRRRFLRTSVVQRPRVSSLSKGFYPQEPITGTSATPTVKPPMRFKLERIVDECGEELDYEASSDDEGAISGDDTPENGDSNI